MARRRRPQPTDATADAAEQAITPRADGQTFDGPDVDDVLQADEPDFPAVVPVSIDQTAPLRVEHVPTRFGGMRTWSLSQTEATRVLSADPRRSVVTLWALTASVRLGASQAEALDSGTAVLAPSVGAVRLGVGDELWAVADAADAQLIVVVEQWTR